MGDRALDETRRYLFAAAGALPPHERGTHAHGRIRAGDEVGERWRGPCRHVVFCPVHTHEPAHRLRDEVEGRAVAVWTVQPEPGDVTGNDVGPDDLELGPREAPLPRDDRRA